MPELALGDSGDLYMDVANSLLPIYQKVGNDWLLLCNLKVPPSGGGGGSGGGAAGGGGSIIIYPKPDGGLPPDKDNDGKPVDKGDIWLDTNSGWLWVYNGSVWLPVGDRPPVSISPTPPLWNPAGDTNNRYPIVEGSLWFDSEQLALYVAALDADDDLVWVIATPADRTAVDDEVNTFVLPASATDRQEEYNPVSDTWYVYNAPKNQWIDFHPNDDPCLEIYGYTLNYNGNTTTNTAFANVTSFAFSIYSRTDYPDNRYNDHYLDAGDGLGWQKVEDMDAATLTKYGIVNVSQWQVSFSGPLGGHASWNNQNVDFPDAQVKGIAIQLDADGNDLVDENGDVIQVESPEIRIYDDPAISIDERDLQPVIASCGPGQSPAKRYLLAHGDTVDDAEGDVTYTWNEGVIIQSEQDGFTGVRLESSRSKLSVFTEDGEGDVKVEADDTFSSFSGSNYLQSTFRTTVKSTGSDVVIEAGAAAAERVNRTIEDTDIEQQIVNKRYVNEQDELLRQDIIELEEEIDAIAPSVERGVWAFNLGGLASSRGQMSMYDDNYTNVGNPIGIFKQAKSIWLNEEDNAGTPHGFANVEAGNLLELFVEGEPDYGLFEVVEVHDETNGASQWWVIEVNFVRALSDTSLASNGDNIRLKIFSAPEGGTADGFVLKSGDTMTGNLSIDNSANGPAVGGSSGKEALLTLKGDRTGTTHAIGTIQFRNASAPTKTGNLTYRTDTENSWFNINAELNISNNGLKTNKLSPYSGSITTFDKKMDFTQTSDVNARFKKGFVIKKQGQSIDGTNILAAYSDFVEYNGPTNTDTRIANRKWIWDNTVRDYKTDSGWSETSGLYINAKSRGKVQNPGGSLLNKHNYEFLVSATGYGSFYVIGNDACVRNDMYVKSFAEDSNPKGNRVATVSSSRSMMSGMRQAILGATDFESLKSSLLAKLEEMENSNEFSEEPTTFDIPE